MSVQRKDPSLVRIYEKQLDQLLASFDINAEVSPHKQVAARLSKVMREVDVWVRGRIIGRQIVVVVECELGSRPLDIGAIDGFVGKLLDLGADRGVLYAASGITPNAVYRAETASNPSVIPVSLEAAPGPRGGPGMRIGWPQPDYAEWMSEEVYRRHITAKQWLPYYAIDEMWEKDQRWAGVVLPEERADYPGASLPP